MDEFGGESENAMANFKFVDCVVLAFGCVFCESVGCGCMAHAELNTNAQNAPNHD
jgi:hypothetical protein